ncbi:MAG: efflux RND transporter permease subunit, partial [Gemmatimonadota bacterium]
YTTYPDVGPAEVERFITEPVERAVGRVPGVQRVSSVSTRGASLVTIRFAWGTEMDFAALHVRERLDNLRYELPSAAGRPTILRTDPGSDPILAIAAAGPDLVALKELADDVFRRRLEQIEGIAQATVVGGLEREIHVQVDPRRLETFAVGIDEVARALDAANYSAPGGTIRRGEFRYALRALGEFQSVDEIGTTVVRRGAGGARVLLRDVAAVEDGFADRETIARYDGREAVGILAFKEAGANTVRVTRRAERVLDELRSEFPGVDLEVASTQARFISDAISNVVQALVLGGILAFLVLFLFLHDPRYPLSIAVSIPLSVAVAFGLLYVAGVSLNIMSLGGLALGVGMLVDNSIVVLENVFRRRAHGAAPLEAAAAGAEEVGGAITAATLTTIAVFLPVIYVKGVAGELFEDLSLAVTFSLLASLAVALTLLPVLLSGRGRAREKGQRAAAGNSARSGRAQALQRFFDACDRVYG